MVYLKSNFNWAPTPKTYFPPKMLVCDFRANKDRLIQQPCSCLILLQIKSLGLPASCASWCWN